jgi:hypothetical protein
MNAQTAKKASERGKRVYAYQFPKGDAPWPMRKTGKVVARSKAEARKELVKRGLLQPFESMVTTFTLVAA